jgi:Fe-S cluster assembly protein SufD
MTELIDEFGIGTTEERAESWRYSQNALRALSQVPFEHEQPQDTLSDALSARIRSLAGKRIVFVNGTLSRDLSAYDESAVTISESIEISERVGELHLVFVNAANGKPQRWQRDIALRAGVDAKIVEHHLGESNADVLGVVTSRATVARGATLDWATIVDIADSDSLVRRQSADISGMLRTTHALAGGRLQRFDIACELIDENARYEGRGALMPSSRQHIDVHLDVHHRARDTSSDVLWRGIADGRGRGILRGAITVAQGADDADAQLQTKNLLLSPHAEIDAQPVLEIYADEVKASHGATVGQLDERVLFYLRSRGIPLRQARDLLIAGFAREAFDRTDGVLRESLDAWLARHTKGAAT